MSDRFTAYLLDARAGVIRPVEVERSNQLKSIYHHIGCTCIDMVTLDDDHVLYCDDNGMGEGLHCYTMLDNFPSPLAGNLLIAGTNGDGDTIAPSAGIKTVAAMFRVVRPVFDPVFEPVSGPGIIGTRINGFKTRLTSQRPAIDLGGNL